MYNMKKCIYINCEYEKNTYKNDEKRFQERQIQRYRRKKYKDIDEKSDFVKLSLQKHIFLHT